MANPDTKEKECVSMTNNDSALYKIIKLHQFLNL